MLTDLRSGAIKLFIAFTLTQPGIALAAEPAPAPAPVATTSTASPSPAPASKSVPAEKSSGAAIQALPTAQPAQPGKPVIRFGFVDMNRFATDSLPGKKISQRLKEKAEKYQAAIISKQKQLEKQKQAIEAKIAQFTPQQKATKAKEFQQKIEAFQKYDQSAEKELRGLEEQLTFKLYQAIEKASTEYGKEAGFAAITARKDLLFLGSGVEGVDVTSAITDRIDKEELKL